MSASGESAPPPAATFESLEAELATVTERLEDASVPLEERLRLHARATSMHRRLEAIVEAARKATSTTADHGASERPPDGEAPPEPYERVRDRLAEVVNALEADDLPLARVIELHREAQRLAARCEAILDGAQEQIEKAAGGPAAPDAPSAPGDAAAARAGDSDSDVPF